MKSNNKVYISGPITGIKNYKDNFATAEKKYSEIFEKVVNPVNNGLPDTASWEEHMRADLKLLLECDTIVLLPGWQNSKGVGVELCVAGALGMEMIFDPG